VLKIEPSDARELPLVRDAPPRLLSEIDKLARSCSREAATALADEAILNGVLGLSTDHVSAMRRAVVDLAAARATR
jgi:hypothetical protein